MPRVFHCPSDGPDEGVTTSYAAVVGPETLWPGSEPVDLGEIRDGLSKRILLVEVASSGIDWMEPRDLSFAKVDGQINVREMVGPSSKHPSVIVVAFADGSARPIQDTIDPKLFKAFLKRAGGEEISEDY
jgi:hypothetical protein